MPEKKDKDGVPVYDFTFEDVVGLRAQLCVRPLDALDLIANSFPIFSFRSH